MERSIEKILSGVRVVPVLTVSDPKEAVALAAALVRGGLTVLEVTLRTPAALTCIKAMIENVGGAIIGAGTVVTPAQMEQAFKAGCKFAVSPGSTDALCKAARDNNLAWLPAASTVSEMMELWAQGFAVQKFFPAQAAGGAAFLSSVASPLPQISFCPTGGITQELAPNYLRLANVIAVGGSWMAPSQLVAGGRWQDIERLAQEAARI